jgi:hypothetical protein
VYAQSVGAWHNAAPRYKGSEKMKYMKRAAIYKANNVTFNPATLEAHSYAWWLFVKRMGPLVVFNAYRYSTATAGHQAKVRTLLRELGIQVHAKIETDKSLDSGAWAQNAIALHKGRIENLQKELDNPRTSKIKNIGRQSEIEEYQARIKQVKGLAKLDKVEV